MASAEIAWPRRGIHPDEAASFLRAVDLGHATVSSTGHVSLHRVRPKAPIGRYALLSKSGAGVSVNLEYLVQIGAVAELVEDFGWPPDVPRPDGQRPPGRIRSEPVRFCPARQSQTPAGTRTSAGDPTGAADRKAAVSAVECLDRMRGNR